MRNVARFRRRDRGFSLLIVFMLIVVMVGAAAGVMLSTQQDLSVAGQERESLQAFYAAEYAVAEAKDLLTSQSSYVYSSTSGWTPLFSYATMSKYLCTGGPGGTNPTTPGTTPATTNSWNDFEMGKPTPFYVGGGTSGGAAVQWRWCVHNDAADPAYANGASWGVSGDSDDSHDGSHLITIEGYGQVIPVGPSNPQPLANGHVWVTVSSPTGTASVPQNCYSQEGGCGGHSANGGALESGITVLTSGSTQRGL